MIHEIYPETKSSALGTTEQPTPPDNTEQQAAAQQSESGMLATAWSYLPSPQAMCQYFWNGLDYILIIIWNIVDGTTDQPTIAHEAEKLVAAQETERSRGIFGFAKSHFSGLVPKLPSLRPISQASFLELDENNYEKEVIYRQIQTRNSKSPAIVNFVKPGYTICGIACVPRDLKTSSPDVKILKGGIGYNNVKLRLTPVYSGPWASCVEILGYKNPQAITQGDNSEISNTAPTPISQEREAAINL